MFIRNRFMFDEGAAGGSAEDGADEKKANDETKTEFLVWLATQPADVQTKYEEHIGGLTSALKKERAAAKSLPMLEKELKEFKAKEEKARKEQMTKEESLTTDLVQSQAIRDQLKAENDQLRISNAVEREAAKLRFTDPVDALQLLPKGSLKVEGDEVVGAAEALKALAKAKPYLLIPDDTEKKKAIGSKTGKSDLSNAEKSMSSVPVRARL